MNTKASFQPEDKVCRQKYMDLFGWLTVVDGKTMAYLWNLPEGITVFLTEEMAQICGTANTPTSRKNSSGVEVKDLIMKYTMQWMRLSDPGDLEVKFTTLCEDWRVC